MTTTLLAALFCASVVNACGPSGCLETVRVVPPGESIELVWTGTALRTTEMEAGCWLNDEGGSCEREIAAPAGSYEVSVTGYAGCMGECACAASGGECEGSVDGVSAVASAFDVSWPDAATVEVVFPLCAFGCAGG